MIKHVISKIPYYMPLLGIIFFTMIAFFGFSFDHMFQKAVIVSSGISYVIWGIVYHYIHRDLSGVIVLEYVAIAALGVASVLSIL